MSFEPLPKEIQTITAAIVDAAFSVHKALGPGLLESVYQACMESELIHRGISFRKEVPVPIIYRDVKLEAGLRLDLLVEELVVLELKAVDLIHPVHEAQVLSY